MRKLNFGDSFKLSRLVKSLGIKEELNEIYKNLPKDEGGSINMTEVGIQILYTVFDKATERATELEIYKFLGGPLEIEPEEVEKLELTDLAEKIVDIADIEVWKSFLKKAAS